MKRLLFAAAAIPAIGTAAYAHEILHADHANHAHGAKCGHDSLEHAGHIDYLHDGHLHHAHNQHVDEHALEVTSTNPEAHELSASVNNEAHPHGHEGEEHMTVQHGTHMDFIHDDRLHHQHGDHADDHGPVKVLAAR